ncbi:MULTISPECIES: alpha/beta fold hydrolase [Photorhabdus]|uniref:Dioxygenase n=1 Tax=Photorhabdus thracensis TaxID=230089 RepID=A0A0F7LJQ5_9GAMM|nr:alpha/beta hydrolase [Photorhabdus thracensis]AKH62323.1 dioxygenase [Photorhabdus thracensis]MCC8420776.1 alpha/beta hydrolase [Photorhabdus thracensis]
MSQFHCNNITIDYNDNGIGPITLLLLPGWCEPKTVFIPFEALAVDSFRVMSLDWRNHGLSSQSASPLTPEILLNDIVSFINSLKIEQLILVSVAHASWIATDIAEIMPERVSALVFLDWIMTNPDPAFFQSISDIQDPENWISARDSLFNFWMGGENNKIIMDHLIKEMSQVDFPVWEAAGKAIAGAYNRYGFPLERLKIFSGWHQCIHIYSLDRSDNYLLQQEKFSSEHSFFQVKRLENSRTHLGILEQPEEVYRVLKAFILKA